MRRAPFFFLVAAALVALLATRVAARSTWIPRIPNRSPTNLIPNADGSAMCVRVGHVGCTGTPPRGGGNDFGRAFVNGGSHWTMQLCLADSDGDGKTNGDELGDVCCTWVEESGVQARVTTQIAHPGFAQSTTSRPSCVHDTPALTTAPVVGDVTSTTIDMSWDALSYATSCWCGWAVQVSSDGTTFTDAGATRSYDTTTASLTGLHPGTAYHVRVVPTAMGVDGSERRGTASPAVAATTTARPCSDNTRESPCHADGCVWCANTQYCQDEHTTCPVCGDADTPAACTNAHCQWCDTTASCHDAVHECANCTMLSGSEQQCHGAGCTYCADTDMCVNHGDSCECTPLEGTCGADGCGGSLGTCGEHEVCTDARACACDTAHDYFGEPPHCVHCTDAGTCSGHGQCTASGQCKCLLQWAGDAHCSSCSDGVSGHDCSTVAYVGRTLIDASYDFSASSMVSTDRSGAAHLDERIVFFRLESTAPGYMAIGISPDGSMTDNGHGSDVIAAFIDEHGHPHVYDYSARAKAPVPLDAEQNVQLMGGQRIGDDRMVVEFARHLTTADTTDDRAFTINTNHLIYAGGSKAPPASGVFGHPQYHDLGHGQWTTELDMGPCDPAVHCNGRGQCLPTGGCECEAPWMTVPGGYGCTEVNYAAVVEMKASYGYRLSMVTAPAAVDDEDQSPIVYMRIQTTEPTAWVALGISLDGTMDSSGAGSDIIVAFVDSANKPHVFDYWAPTAAAPLLDDQQDVHMWRGSPTTFEFYRRANTSDPFDRVIQAGDNTFIYAARKFSTDALPPANGNFAHVPPHNMDKGAASVRMFVGMCNVAECVHGECSDGEGCVCERGWGGPFCNTEVACNAATTCHGHGTCAADNSCKCDAGYSGVDCSIFGSSFSNADGTWSVQWAFSSDHKDITFTISARTGGWSAIGFNTQPMMKGADMVVAWVDGDNKLRVSDRHSGGHAVPSVDAHDDVQHASGSQKGSGASTETTWAFTRALDTGDNDDAVIPNSVHGYGEFYLLWAYGTHDGTDGADGSFAKHTARKAVKMNLMSGAAKTVSLTDYVTPHAVLMVIGWGVCVFVGAFIARFYKHIGHRWYQLHVSLQSLGVMIALVAFALGVKSVDRGGEHFTKTHHKIGLALMVIGVVQGFLGYLANKMWNPDRKGVPFFPDRLHWILGYVCMALTPAAIFTGMQLRGNVAMGLVVVYAAWLGAFVAIYVYKSLLAVVQGKSLEHDPSMYSEMGDSGPLPTLPK